jgi:hypothetical protein
MLTCAGHKLNSAPPLTTLEETQARVWCLKGPDSGPDETQQPTHTISKRLKRGVISMAPATAIVRCDLLCVFVCVFVCVCVCARAQVSESHRVMEEGRL